MQACIRIAVDTGGTFTDLCLLDERSGRFSVIKLPSTPANPALAVIEGVKKILAGLSVSPAAVSFFIHGTTVATNALLEGKGAPVSLITTEGFEDVILIGRQNRPKLYDHWARRPRPLVPRSRCFGVRERILHNGDVLTPMDECQVEEIVKTAKAAGTRSIAVSLMHAYANPTHEIRIKEIVEDIFPESYVTLSSDVLPEFREYERTSTICINAYVMPRVNDYVQYLEERLQKIGVASELYIMQSNGGVITAETARSMSARTVLSGPAGGALTGAMLAGICGSGDIITVDVGGTSSDICLIEDREPRLTTESDIEGYPIKLPMIDINTIGAGGGSIAWIDSGGALQVGPVSAGADPGPICYGRGGTEPTVTDANAILGRINPDYLLGGDMPVYLDDARRIVNEKIAKPLKLNLFEAAEGIIRVVNANMIRGIRRVSVERGYDPREFVLVPFGGAGPLHGAELALALNMKVIVIPAHPGIGSAFGMLSADVRHDFVKTYVSSMEVLDYQRMENYFRSMEEQAVAQLAKENFTGDAVVLNRMVDMRYLRQAYELTVPFTDSRCEPKSLAELQRRFHEIHNREYGYAREQETVEIVNLRLVALGKLPGLQLQAGGEESTGKPQPFAYRQVYFNEKPLNTGIFKREDLMPGQEIAGPAVIEQLDSTIVLPPEFNAKNDLYGNLILKIKDDSL
jgi:N-methylhydantoinase A